MRDGGEWTKDSPHWTLLIRNTFGWPSSSSRTLHANRGMSEPRGRLARWSVSLRAVLAASLGRLARWSASLRAVLAASLGAHRKAQHARVCFAGGRYFSRQRQLRECRCSARSAKRLAESSLGNCMLGVWLCPSRSRAPGGTRGGTGCKGAHHRSRYSPIRTLVRSAPPNHGEVMRGPCQRKGIRSKRDQTPPRHSV